MSSSATTLTFSLPNTSPGIQVSHPPSLSKDQILAFPAFKTWLSTLNHSLSLQHTSKSHPFHPSPYSLKSIEIQAVDFFSAHRLGFLKLKATIANEDGEHLPGSVFMRGGSVAMLVILRAQEEPASSTRSTQGPAAPASEQVEYALLTVQPRIAAGSLGFTEIPAGMIDDSGTFAGAAAKEIREETGLEISSEELLDMTQLARQCRATDSTADGDGDGEEHLQTATYPSPGGSDEFIPLFLARKTLPRARIEDLRGKLTGLRDEGEKITLKIVRLDDLWKVAWRDGKTLAAWALYQGLRGEGKI